MPLVNLQIKFVCEKHNVLLAITRYYLYNM